MTITQFLALFYPISETAKGWDVCCPAHDDQHPSLGVMEGDEGRIVLNCFAGCTPQSICTALNLQLSDLFQGRPLLGDLRPRYKPWRPVPPVKLAFAYELHALDLRMQAEKIFEAAKDCADHESWTNDELDVALRGVKRGYAYLEWAQFCEEYADHLREKDHEFKGFASRQP